MSVYVGETMIYVVIEAPAVSWLGAIIHLPCTTVDQTPQAPDENLCQASPNRAQDAFMKKHPEGHSFRATPLLLS